MLQSNHGHHAPKTSPTTLQLVLVYQTQMHTPLRPCKVCPFYKVQHFVSIDYFLELNKKQNYIYRAIYEQYLKKIHFRSFSYTVARGYSQAILIKFGRSDKFAQNVIQ